MTLCIMPLKIMALSIMTLGYNAHNTMALKHDSLHKNTQHKAHSITTLGMEVHNMMTIGIMAQHNGIQR